LLHKLVDIFKSRWPEVILVVVLQVGLMLLLQRMMLSSGAGTLAKSQIPDWALFVLGAGCMLMVVVWQMLYLGFLRTAATDGATPHEPLTLLLIGRPFFWRFLGVQFVMGAGLWVVSMVRAGVAGAMLGYGEARAIPPWLLEAASIAAIALFVKPFFLIPAFILAMDFRAIEALAMMRQIRLAELGPLLKGYAVGLGVIVTVAVVSSLAPRGGAIYLIAAGLNYLVQSATGLTLMLATVLFVAEEADLEASAEMDNRD